LAFAFNSELTTVIEPASVFILTKGEKAMKSARTLVTFAVFVMALPLLHAADLAAPVATGKDESAVSAVLLKTWSRPDAPLSVAPVTIVDNYALAGWAQGERGGRALLMRKPDGEWAVQLCGGDALKAVETLKQSQVPDAIAKELSARNATAEAEIPSATRALFSTFGATVRHGGHH
jgi:hypothetical protein